MMSNFHPNPSPSPQDIKRLLAESDGLLTVDYVQWITAADGGSGPIGTAAHLILWTCNHAIHANHAYDLRELVEDTYLIGSNGGGEVFAIQRQATGSSLYVSLPVIDMCQSNVVEMGSTFFEFIQHLFELE